MNQEDSLPLPQTARLRLIADMIREAQDHRRYGRTGDDTRLRREADAIALEVLRERTKAHHEDEPLDVKSEVEWIAELCSHLSQALSGSYPKTHKDDAQNRVLEAVNSFCAEHGEYPTNADLRKRGVHPTDIANVTELFRKLGNKPILKPIKNKPIKREPGR